VSAAKIGNVESRISASFQGDHSTQLDVNYIADWAIDGVFHRLI